MNEETKLICKVALGHCGANNKKLFKSDKPYVGDEGVILDVLKDIKKELK